MADIIKNIQDHYSLSIYSLSERHTHLKSILSSSFFEIFLMKLRIFLVFKEQQRCIQYFYAVYSYVR